MTTQRFDHSKDTRSFTTWLILLFGLTGVSIALLWLSGINPGIDFSPYIILIAYSPSLAALITVALFGGKAGLKNLLEPLTKWRVSVWWYVLVLGAPLLIMLLANLLYATSGGTPLWSEFFVGAALLSGIGPILAGSFGEEIGWRGFAQPLLQKTNTALTAAIIVGIIWATWHLWPILAPGGLEHLVSAEIIQTYVRLISTAIIYAWILNSTGSLLIVLLAHAGHNISTYLIPIESNMAAIIMTLLYTVAALIVIYLTNIKTLTSRTK